METLRKLRDVGDELAFRRDWIAQKERVLRDKCRKLKRFRDDIGADRHSLCFGSKKLLAQRQSAHVADTTLFDSVESWRAAFNNACDAQWWSVVYTHEPGGNEELRWLPETHQLCIRLPLGGLHSSLLVERGRCCWRFLQQGKDRSSLRCAVLNEGVNTLSKRLDPEAALSS